MYIHVELLNNRIDIKVKYYIRNREVFVELSLKEKKEDRSERRKRGQRREVTDLFDHELFAKVCRTDLPRVGRIFGDPFVQSTHVLQTCSHVLFK